MSAWALTHEQYDSRLPRGLRSGCQGVFRVEDDAGKGPVVTRCDGCRQLLGVARKVFDAGTPTPRTPEMPTDGAADPEEVDAMEAGIF